ncbi:MBL fold metallo-hydrolase [Sinorhizobium meliloti]|nr:MBL fold metallo-hydrolase [Sinorhizobium meliloti]
MKVESRLYVAGHCLNFSAATLRGDPWRVERYPAICAYIRHPVRGHVVFDTGYSQGFFSATRSLPFRLYRMATPVRLAPRESLAEQLTADGVLPPEVDTVILSHFHADHVGGLRDFPNARIVAHAGAWSHVRDDRGLKALRKGFVPSLMPDDVENRLDDMCAKPMVRLPDQMRPFDTGYDLFGDGSLVAVPLEGHARHQIGILFDDERHGRTFLCADAAWSRRAIREKTGPGRLGYMAVDNPSETDETLSRLHELYVRNPTLRIVPSHCQEVWKEIRSDRRV